MYVKTHSRWVHVAFNIRRKDTVGCVKRFIAREVFYRVMNHDTLPAPLGRPHSPRPGQPVLARQGQSGRRVSTSAHQQTTRLRDALAWSPRDDVTFQVRDELRRRFVDRLKAAAAEAPVVVVSHSMGTIIAYDCLMHEPDCPPVAGLITVGSPLGLDEVHEGIHSPGQPSSS